MKLARFTLDGVTRIGVVEGDRVFAVSDLDPSAPVTIRDVLAAGAPQLERLRAALSGKSGGYAVEEVRFELPMRDGN